MFGDMGEGGFVYSVGLASCSWSGDQPGSFLGGSGCGGVGVCFRQVVPLSVGDVAPKQNWLLQGPGLLSKPVDQVKQVSCWHRLRYTALFLRKFRSRPCARLVTDVELPKNFAGTFIAARPLSSFIFHPHVPPSATTMDFAREFMGDIDHDYDPNATQENPDEELLEMDNTLAPPGLRLAEVLMDRHWVFEEVLWISGAGSNLSRQELASAVADAKGVDDSRVDVCFFDEDEVGWREERSEATSLDGVFAGRRCACQ